MKAVNVIKFKEPSEECKLPLFTVSVQAGFPSPADDYYENKLDLNELLVKNKVATYFVRVAGDSMVNAGIHSGDILVVDRSLEATEGKIVIAEVNGELTVKRMERIKGSLCLVAENEAYEPIPITAETQFQIWGVVTYAIHKPQ
jgi:DNA polymerase V